MTTPALPRRVARPLLLLAVRKGRAAHGYELFETIRDLGVAIDLAGVYRELRSMEHQDLLTSSWQPSDAGPDRRVYRLTGAGRAAAAAALDDLVRTRDQLDAALGALTTPAPAEP